MGETSRAKGADPREARPKALTYSELPVVRGKHIYRVRQSYLRDVAAPLLASRNLSALKLDLVLRGLALRAQDLGNRDDEPGLVLPTYPWEALHDLCRPTTHFRGRQSIGEVSSQRDRDLKNEWVRTQLARLEGLKLVRREPKPGSRSRLYVLSDRGDGQLYDDPGDAGDPYVRLLGAVIACGAWAEWSTREVVGYLAALVAQGYDTHRDQALPGAGRWWRPAAWFADDDGRRPDNHIRIPFSESTVKRGVRALVEDGWIHARWISENPDTGARLGQHRRLYTNRFIERAQERTHINVGLDEVVNESNRKARSVEDLPLDMGAETTAGATA